jgi:hypothetical protein
MAAIHVWAAIQTSMVSIPNALPCHTIPCCPAPGHLWVGTLAEAIRMLESDQFQSTYAVRNVLSDLKVLLTINQRHGTTEPDDWTCSMGNAPTERDGWNQYHALLQTKPRQVVV